MKLLGYTTKDGETINYNLIFVDKYYDPNRIIVQKGRIVRPDPKWMKDAIDRNCVMNHISYDRQGTRHALVVPSLLCGAPDIELYTHYFMICVQQNIREKGNVKQLLAGTINDPASPVSYVKLHNGPKKQVSLEHDRSQATILNGQDMLRAMRTVLRHTDLHLNDIIAIDVMQSTTWQLSRLTYGQEGA